MSQFGTQGNNPPWARTNGQNLPPPLGQPGQMQAPPIIQHSLLNQQVSFQQQQQQVYQQSIQTMQQQQQQQPAPGMIGQQIQLGADKSKGYAAPGIPCYPFQTPQLGGLGAAGGLQPLHSLQGTIQSTPQQGPISYPAPRSMRNFTNQPPPLTNVINSSPQPVPQQNQITPKNRVFNGVITKLHENFGFIDEEVFFNLSVVTKGLPPVVGERALVEASFNPNMPFKWNATKVQVLPSDRQNSNGNVGGFGVVPPPHNQFGSVASGGSSGGGNDSYGPNEQTRNRPAERRREVMRRGSRERDREVERERERERRRDDRQKEREKEREKEKRSRLSRSPSEPARRRSRSPRATRVASRSPPRRRARVMPRYVVQIPKISLEITEANMPELKRRYTNLYLPSDFFVSNFRWVDAFPAHRPFSLNKSCAFHVMHKDVNEIVPNDAVLEPHDADYSFSAKVMLISIPVLEELYRKSCALAEDIKDGEERDGYVHPTRLINFLVGVRGKTKETMAIGGPWSPSLDGPNPDKDPSVLIKTAIRTCKALTGVDLSPCTQWYRFVEIYYHRSETTHKGKVIPPRVETVVLFLPDVWSCLPTRLEWESMQLAYKKQLCRKLKADEAPDAAAAAEPAAAAAVAAAEEAPENHKEEEKMETDGEKKPEPTHFSELDVKVMKVSEMRLELEARTLNSKGLKSQLVARLTKALKTEQELEEAGAKAAEQAAVDKAAESEETSMDIPTESNSDKKEDGERSKSHEDKEKQARYERRFVLPENPHIIVHPSKTAKSGKFDCTLMSLSLLLDYRQEDTKEHSFEVSLFAELFNEMLRRDFGFRIYKSFVDFPEKPKTEEKEKSGLKHEKKDDETDNQESKSDDKDVAEEEDDDKEDGQSCSSFGSKKKDAKDSKEKESKEKAVKKVKMVTVNPGLLLAFVYFDQSHCGYILNKDLEEIVHTLGLNLSRAQVKRLLLRVVARDTFNYRKLTDRSEAELNLEAEKVEDDEKTKQLAYGNHRLLPVFASENRSRDSSRQLDETADKSAANSGVIIYNGCAVDVGKLLQQLERSEKSRVDTEEKMVQLEKQLVQAKDSSKASSENASKLAEQLKDCKSRLSDTEEGLKKEKESNTRYLTAINKVNDIVSTLATAKEDKN